MPIIEFYVESNAPHSTNNVCRLCTLLIDVNYCVLLIIGIINRPVANANHTIFFNFQSFLLTLMEWSSKYCARNKWAFRKKNLYISLVELTREQKNITIISYLSYFFAHVQLTKKNVSFFSSFQWSTFFAPRTNRDYELFSYSIVCLLVKNLCVSLLHHMIITH